MIEDALPQSEKVVIGAHSPKPIDIPSNRELESKPKGSALHHIKTGDYEFFKKHGYPRRPFID
jgi:hypothetical protein